MLKLRIYKSIKFFTIFLLLNLPCLIFSQIKVSGTFVEENGQSVIFPQIIVKQDSLVIIETTSDVDGKFVLSMAPGHYTFIVYQFNQEIFRKDYLFSSDTDLGTIQVDNSIDLAEINVVAQRKTIDLRGDRIIYNVANDRFVTNTTLSDLFKRVPSLTVRNEDQIEILGKNQVRYMINGRVLELSEESVKLLLKSMKSEDIDKIEVISTPPAKYSADKNYGFINIITKRDETIGLKGDAYVNLIQKNRTSTFGGVNLNYSNRKLEAFLSVNAGQYYATNVLRRNYTFIDKNQFSYKETNSIGNMMDINSILKYNISDKIEVGSVFNFTTNKLTSNDTDKTEYNSLLNAIYNTDSTITTVSDALIKPEYATLLSTYMDYEIDSLGKVVTLTYNHFKKNSESTSTIHSLVNSKDNSYNLDTYGKNKYKINSLKVDAVLPFKHCNFEIGGAYTVVSNVSNIDIKGSSQINLYDNFKYNEKTSALYFSIDKRFNSQLYGKAGLRYEYTDLQGISITNEKHASNYGYFFPTLYLTWNARKGNTFSLAYATRLERPYFNDLNPFRYYTTIYNYTSGNPSLLPAISHNLEIKYSKGNKIYSVLYGSKTMKAVDYVTVFDDSGSQYTMPYNNITHDKVGYYLSYTINPVSFLNLSLNGDLFYSKFTSSNPNLKTVDIEGYGTMIGVKTDWILNKKKTLLLHIGYTHMFPKFENMMRYKSIVLFDTNLRYSMLSDKLKFILRINDPFKQNITIIERQYSDFNYKSIFDAKVRNISLTVSYSFGKSKVNNVYRDAKDVESQRSNK